MVWSKKQFNQHRRNQRKKHGDKCVIPNCRNRENLEFAHIRPTKLSGMSRGSRKRFYDVKNNPNSYRLMCKRHHDVFDGRC